MTKERLFILIRRFFFDYLSQNFLFKAQDNFQTFMINPFRTTSDFFFKNRMIGFDFKAFKFENRLYYDIILAFSFSYHFFALRNKIVNDGLNYLTHFFDYAFSTYGISKSNSSIFININAPKKKLQLFLKHGFIVNILDCLKPRQKFHNKNYGNFDYQIRDSFAFETKALVMRFFMITSLPQIICSVNQMSNYFLKNKLTS
jgi:hypothetical protein